jgi:HEAT repeat protein
VRWEFDFRSAALSVIGELGEPGVEFLPELFRRIEHGGPDVFDEDRWTPKMATSLRAIVGTGDAAVPRLVEALSSRSKDVRQTAAVALGFLEKEPDKALPVLIESLRGDCDGFCAYVFVRYDELAIARYGEHAVAELLKLGTEEDEDLDRVVDNALSHMDKDDRAVTKRLLAGARDANSAIRRRAVRHLGWRPAHAESIRPILKDASGDPDESVRTAAARALEHLDEAVARDERKASTPDRSQPVESKAADTGNR